MPKRKRQPKKLKKKLSKKQLKALARGRAIRRRNLGLTHKRRHKKKTKRRKPPMKRRRVADTLTGGTKDVNPQWFGGCLAQVGVNVALSFEVSTPISRLPKYGNKVTVMEILKFSATLPNEYFANVNETEKLSQITLGTKNFAAVAVGWDDPSVIAHLSYEMKGAFTAAGTYGFGVLMPIIQDITDGNGHGVLIATDNMYIQIATVGFIAIGQWRFKILYRFKDVSLTEYIGIVQSQQG